MASVRESSGSKSRVPRNHGTTVVLPMLAFIYFYLGPERTVYNKLCSAISSCWRSEFTGCFHAVCTCPRLQLSRRVLRRGVDAPLRSGLTTRPRHAGLACVTDFPRYVSPQAAQSSTFCSAERVDRSSFRGPDATPARATADREPNLTNHATVPAVRTAMVGWLFEKLRPVATCQAGRGYLCNRTVPLRTLIVLW